MNEHSSVSPDDASTNVPPLSDQGKDKSSGIVYIPPMSEDSKAKLGQTVNFSAEQPEEEVPADENLQPNVENEHLASSPEDIQPEEVEETPGSKIQTLLDKDIAEVNSVEKKFSERSLQWLQKNSKLRIATGIAVSGIAAFSGMNTAIWAAKGVLGAAGGAIGLSGFKAGRREQATLNKFNNFVIKSGPDAGQLDTETINQKVLSGEIEIQDVKELYKEFTEIASAQGRKIDAELQKKEQETAGKLKGRFANNKKVQWFNNLNWKWKAAMGVGIAIGAGSVGAATAGGLVGASLARVLFSGAAQLGMSAIQKSPETNSIAYAHSDKIENLKNIIEQNGGLSEDDVKAFSQYREDVRRGRIKDAALGGVVMGTLIGGTAALFGHHSVEHGGTDHRVIGVAKPGAAEASVPSAQPGIHTGNEPIVKIEETTPGHGLHLTSEYQKVLSGEIAKGDTKAAQHLAEVELRGQLGKIGEHFKNHADFEKARDTLVAGWHTKHPEMFGVDGSIKPEHMNDIAATLQSVDAKTVLESSTTFLVADNAIGPHHLAAEPHGIGAAEHSAKAMTPAETENAAREHLNQVAGAKVPPTWHTGGDYAAYNQGKSLNDVGTIEALKGKQISSDSLHYLKKLLELHRLKPEDVHVSPDGKHLMFNAPNSAARNIIWTTELRDKSVFSRLFPGRTADVKEIFPQGQAKIDAATIVQPKNIDQPASHIEKSSLSTPDSHNVVNPEKSSLSTPDKSVVVDGNKDLHAGGQTGEEQNLHTQPADQANVAAEHVVQKASEVKFSEIPKDVLDNMSKDHPDWSDAQKLEDYQEYLKSLGM